MARQGFEAQDAGVDQSGLSVEEFLDLV